MTTTPQPLYIAHNLRPAYQLRYGWSGWPSQGDFLPEPPPSFLKELAPLWEKDNLRLLEHAWSSKQISLTFSATPEVSPVFLATRVKGRLQHAFRQEGKPIKFSRKLALRTIGHNTRETVESYIRKQLDREKMADLRYEDRLRSHAINDPTVNLSLTTETGSGRYWYNLHLVLVVADRYRMGWDQEGKNLSVICQKIAQKKGYSISTLSLMPDHLHIALRGNVEDSPEDIALSFQNNLAYLAGGCRIWEHNYYVGTFGEYTMGAVRR
jgi:REP element-mobilizing transposase RayT